MRRLIFAALTASLAGPTLAASVPYCPQPHPGLVISFHIGSPMTESEENAVYLRLLKKQGVKVSLVRRWNGCIQAFVRDADGHGEHLEYYDPDTLERIVLTRTGPSLFGN